LTRLRIGILKADSVLPDLAVKHGEYPDMFREVLRAADPEADVRSFDVENGVLPTRADACDGYVITGSRRSVYEGLPWIESLTEWIRATERDRTPLVGVCFGHQLVAQALGGRTAKADRGWTIGVQSYDFEHPLPFDEERKSLRLIHSHQDQVLELPEGAQRIGGNAACPIALYGIGDHVLCVQGHPEFSPEYARDLYAKRREVFGEPLYSSALESLDTENDRVPFARGMLEFVRRGAARS
jgi:GMP synthase-like glutamine amidotransferase